LEIHPWAEEVLFARTGGEAMAVAVRIARAYADLKGKGTNVALCGYHGWHDWYIATNLSDPSGLNDHLIPWLKPLGIPKALAGTSLEFKYNDISSLEKIVKKKKIGVIVMETVRHMPPKNNFLKKVKEVAEREGAVLIFDEVSCGFRYNLGGAHLVYGVVPDVAVFSKAMANGYAMAAVIGKKEIMDMRKSTFISSTMWSERIGTVAAIATINKLKKLKVHKYLETKGEKIKNGLERLAKKHKIPLKTIWPNSLIILLFGGKNPMALKTLFSQEMLKKGFLAINAVYVSYAHTNEIIKRYLKAVDEVFTIMSKAIKEKKVMDSLENGVAPSGYFDEIEQ